MSSLAEQIAETVRVALTGTIAAVGSRVYRARQDVISREECPAIAIHLLNESAEPATLDDEVDECVLDLSVTVHVIGGSDAWETVADQIAVAIHPLVRAAVYPGNAAKPRKVNDQWEAVSGDGSPGERSLQYQFIYHRSASALDVSA